MTDDQYTIIKRDLKVKIQEEMQIIIGEEALKVMSDCVKHGSGYFKIGTDGELIAVSAKDVDKQDD